MRTVRDGIDRRPRHERDQLAVLSRQWDRCVAYAATNSPSAGDDPTFGPRAAELSALVESVQVRADACPGCWSLGGGGGDRRVLDALCMLTLAGMRPAVQADIRRLALLCGIGRETARTALHRLAATGWIRHASPSTGRHGASWALAPPAGGLSTGGVGPGRSQAAPPRGAAEDREYWLTLLGRRLETGRHDVFCGRGLGFVAGNAYARLHEHPRRGHAALPELEEPLERLDSHGLTSWTRHGWRPAPTARLNTAADQLGVSGVLAARSRAYAVERALWEWWQHELAWMRQPRPSRRRQPQTGQLGIDGSAVRYGPHPRRPSGRADYRAARIQLKDRHRDPLARPRVETSPPPAACRRRRVRAPRTPCARTVGGVVDSRLVIGAPSPTSGRPGRPLSPVQEILASGYLLDSHRDQALLVEPDAYIRLLVDEAGRWSATLCGPVFDRPPADALTVPLAESVHLLASAASAARRPLVVHTIDERGVRHIDVINPPPHDFHQVPAAAVDTAADADAIRAGREPAVWAPDRIVWSPTVLRTRTRRLTLGGKGAAVGAALVSTVAAVGLSVAALGSTRSDQPAPAPPNTVELVPATVNAPTSSGRQVSDRK